MDTPILDFVNAYAASGSVRLHMPGHKGRAFRGCESLDITEIAGADALYEADGLIAKSEENAAALFGTCKTLYSTEGSSQCIRAMLHLALSFAVPALLYVHIKGVSDIQQGSGYDMKTHKLRRDWMILTAATLLSRISMYPTITVVASYAYLVFAVMTLLVLAGMLTPVLAYYAMWAAAAAIFAVAVYYTVQQL